MSGNSSVNARFRGGYDLGQVHRYELREFPGKHQTVAVDFAYGSKVILPEAGVPSTIDWAVGPSNRTFYGYVRTTEHVTSTPIDYTRVWLVGTSSPMNNPQPFSWTNVTASFIAREIARRHGLRCVLHKTTRILKFFSTQADGDFKTMNRLAEEEGYLFWVDGGTLYFLDPTILVSMDNSRDVFEFESDSRRIDRSTLKEARRWTGPIVGTGTDNVSTITYGISPDNRLIKSKSAPVNSQVMQSPYTRINTRAAYSMNDAVAKNMAAMKNTAWSYQRLIVMGDPNISLGKIAKVTGDNVSAESLGHWMIRGVTHVMAKGNETSRFLNYTCELDVARNSTKAQIYNSTGQIMAFTTNAATLRNGTTWESSMMGSVYV